MRRIAGARRELNDHNAYLFPRRVGQLMLDNRPYRNALIRRERIWGLTRVRRAAAPEDLPR